MGNDGGSIPKRRELVKEAARLQTVSEVKESQQEKQEYQWSICPVSQQPLKEPIVSDSVGNLYNKDAILEFLLPSDDPDVEEAKADKEQILGGRVKGLRDVVEIKFHQDDGDDQRARKNSDPMFTRWVCPITNKILGAGVKSVYIVPCGHAYSDTALKEVSENSCLQCNEPFDSGNIITILPISPEDKARLTRRMDKLKEQGLTHALKKAPGSSKKRKKHGNGSIANGIETEKAPAKSSTPKTASGTATPTGGIKNAATASLTAKVLAEEAAKNKKRKLDGNDNLKSLFTSKKADIKDGDFMTRGFSIPARR